MSLFKLKLSICAVSLGHRPQPSRYVIHHIQPLVCGGLKAATNQITLCDNCHYTVHRLMFQLANGVAMSVGNRRQRAIATDGYARCVAAGTVGKIPNEG